MKKKTNVELMQEILPSHYVCEKRVEGVYCHSKTGIDDTPPEKEWPNVFKKIKKAFGSKFSEVYHQTCANHKRFTVYLKASSPQKVTWLNQPGLTIK